MSVAFQAGKTPKVTILKIKKKDLITNVIYNFKSIR